MFICSFNYGQIVSVLNNQNKQIASPNTTAYKILLHTKTSGFDHNTRVQAEAMLTSLEASLNFELTVDNVGTEFDNQTTLNEYDIIFFSNTTGDFLTDSQQARVEVYAAQGGNFIGNHGSSDCYGHSSSVDASSGGAGTWDWYAENVTGVSQQKNPSHTASANVSTTVTIQNANTDLTNGITFPWSDNDEWYYWEKGYIDPDFTELLRIASTGGATWDASRMTAQYWERPDGGVSLYTSMGHSQSKYSDADFVQLITNFILYIKNYVPSSPDIIAPTSPSNFLASNINDTSIDLSWTASTDAVGVTNYTIYNSDVFLTNTGSNAASFTLTGLTPSTSYSLTIRGVDAATNESANSNTITPTTTASPTDPVCNLSEVNLSDLNWVSAQQGWGTPTLNTNLSGNPLTINGQNFSHGIGTHAQSEIIYDLTTNNYQSFKSYIGIDDNVAPNNPASVQFEILGDGVSLFRSQTLTSADDAEFVEVQINGLSQLTLVVDSMGPDAYDHADWAEAVFTYCTDVTPTDLIGSWALSADGIDASGNGNNLTLFGTPTFTTEGGREAMQLNGTSQYAATLGDLINGFTEVTIMGWAKLDPTAFAEDRAIFTTNTGTYNTVFDDSPPAFSLRYDHFGFVSNNAKVMKGQTLGEPAFESQADSYVDNTWYHWALVFEDGVGMRFYRNGVELTLNTPIAKPTTMTVTGQDIFSLGRGTRENQFQYFKGWLSDWKIYNTAKNATFILADKNATE